MPRMDPHVANRTERPVTNPSELLQNPLVTLSCILFLGILAQWIAWRLRLPSILLLLGGGFLLRYLGDVNPDAFIGEDLLFPIVSLCVAVIMFEGGLTLQLSELKSSGNIVFRLVTIGCLISWFLTSLVAISLFEMSGRVAAMVGSILVVTGPTVIMPLLRHVRPSRKVATIVKWEGIVIDPIGAMLAALVFVGLFSEPTLAEGANLGTRFWLVAGTMARAIVIGVSLGFLGAWTLVYAMRNYLLPDFLHNAVSLAVALALFTFSNVLQDESGLLTVTLLGILLANQNKVPVKHVVEFKENLRVLLISCLFIVLAARIELEQILELGWRGAAFLLALIVVVRPASVWLSTVGTELHWRERVFVALLAPRGIVAAAVSAVFALHILGHAQTDQSDSVAAVAAPHAAHDAMAAEADNRPPPGGGFIGGAAPHPTNVAAAHPVALGTELIVPITFLVIVGSVAFYGLLAAPLARWLGLSEPNPQGILFAGASDWAREIALILVEEGVAVRMVDTNYRNISIARQEGIPVYCASILSEYISDEIELSGIGRLLAATPNDDLNRLATMEFAHDFGMEEVYQLPPWERSGATAGHRETAPAMNHGRLLFRADANFGNLAERMASGQEIKRTKITDEFTLESFTEFYGEDALILFIKRTDGDLDISTVDKAIEPEPGDMLIALVPPDINPRGS